MATQTQPGATPAGSPAPKQDPANQPKTQPGATPEGDKGATPLIFDDWQSEQPDEVKTMLDGRFHNLENALGGERSTVKTLQTELKELSKTADDATKTAIKDIEARLGATIEASESKADFFQTAAAQGCNNLNLAWLAANDNSDRFFDKRGNVKFDLLKEDNPQLFTTAKLPKTNAGQGNGQQIPGGAGGFDAILREAVARKRVG